MCQAVERELMSVIGIDSYKASPRRARCSFSITRRTLRREQLIEILESAVKNIAAPVKKDKPDLLFPLCTVSLPLAAAAQFAVPVLLPVSAALVRLHGHSQFQGRLQVFPKNVAWGSTCWIRSSSGSASRRARYSPARCCAGAWASAASVQEDAGRLQEDADERFGKAPRFVWLYRDGVEIETPAGQAPEGDMIVVKTGEVVPVDGFVAEGMAVIDQHSLTGESTPAEKGVGDRVFASTLMVAGKICVAVESSGGDTTSAKIGKILHDSAGYKLSRSIGRADGRQGRHSDPGASPRRHSRPSGRPGPSPC